MYKNLIKIFKKRRKKEKEKKKATKHEITKQKQRKPQ